MVAKEIVTTCYICDACDKDIFPHSPCIMCRSQVISQFSDLRKATNVVKGLEGLPPTCPFTHPIIRRTTWRIIPYDQAASIILDFGKRSCIDENGFIEDETQSSVKQKTVNNRFSDIDIIERQTDDNP